MRTTPRMGLTSWDQPQDFYNSAQLAGNWQIVDFHDHTPGRGVPVAAGGIAPGAVLSQNIAAGVVGSQHLSQSLVQDLGINGGGSTGRGVFAQASAGTTSSTSFTTLTNGPDQVAGVVLGTNGVIMVDFHALWEVTSTNTGSADVFIGSNELISGATGVVAPATTTSTTLVSLTSAGAGLTSGSATWSSDPATGVSVGGGIKIYGLPAGTYTVGVQYKVNAGTLTVQNRHLLVSSTNFE